MLYEIVNSQSSAFEDISHVVMVIFERAIKKNCDQERSGVHQNVKEWISLKLISLAMELMFSCLEPSNMQIIPCFFLDIDVIVSSSSCQQILELLQRSPQDSQESYELQAILSEPHFRVSGCRGQPTVT